MSPRDKRVSVAPNVLVRELQGESVLLNLDSEAYFGLDEVGTGMWRALAASATLDEACDLLLAEYDVEPRQLREDLEAFVSELAKAGLVDIVDVQP
jgi:hypothetical protein